MVFFKKRPSKSVTASFFALKEAFNNKSIKERLLAQLLDLSELFCDLYYFIIVS